MNSYTINKDLQHHSAALYAAEECFTQGGEHSMAGVLTITPEGVAYNEKPFMSTEEIRDYLRYLLRRDRTRTSRRKAKKWEALNGDDQPF